MAYGQVMACLLKLILRNMFIVLGKSCGKNSCSYFLLYVKGTFVFTSYTLSPIVRFQNLGFGIWNSALNNSWIPGIITEFWNPSFTDWQVICAIQNPRLSWTTLHHGTKPGPCQLIGIWEVQFPGPGQNSRFHINVLVPTNEISTISN